MSNESEPTKPPPSRVVVNRSREADFAERVGRSLTSATDLLARLGRSAAVATAPDTPLQTSWDLDSLTRHVAARAAKFIGAESLDPEADFFDMGGTSVKAVELMGLLSKELGLEIKLDDLFADGRPQRLAQQLLAQLEAAAPSKPQALSAPAPVASPAASVPMPERPAHLDEELSIIEADLELASRLPWVQRSTVREVPRHILLTGATGFLGSQMLFDLLRHSDAHVYCLVRAKTDEEATARMARELEVRELLWSRELQRRVTVVAGDIQEDGFGWSEERMATLAEQIDAIVNVAAAVDFVRGYASLRRTNVLGPLHLAKFATRGRVKSFHQISTISIFDEIGIQSMGEDDPPAHVTGLHAGYERTKWVAEAILRRAQDRGLMVSFYRPGGIAGNSITGVYNPLDLNTGFMAAWQALRAMPEFTYVHSAPVDWVSRIASELVLDPSTWGYSYHLTGKPTDLATAARNMALAGNAVQIQTLEQWRDTLLQKMATDPVPYLMPLAMALRSHGAMKLVEATMSAPPARTERTDAFIRRRKLPAPRSFDARAMIAVNERMLRDGRVRLPGRDDAQYIRFTERMEGQLGEIEGTDSTPCNARLQVSVASFYQMLKDRRLDLHGELQCALIDTQPLEVVDGSCWVRPADGVPLAHGIAHPLLHYKMTLQAQGGTRWWLDGTKVYRSGRDFWRQGRTMAFEMGREGAPASFAGEMVVPTASYMPDQIDALEIDPAVPRQQQGLAKLLWLLWFGGQFGIGFSEPLMRSWMELVDSARGITQKVQR